jgi:hypothetical protein
MFKEKEFVWMQKERCFEGEEFYNGLKQKGV